MIQTYNVDFIEQKIRLSFKFETVFDFYVTLRGSDFMESMRISWKDIDKIDQWLHGDLVGQFNLRKLRIWVPEELHFILNERVLSMSKREFDMIIKNVIWIGAR